MDDVRKEIETGQIVLTNDDGLTVTIKMSPELQKAMQDKLDKYDRFMAKKFERVHKYIEQMDTE